jgi:siroheme synthase
MVIADRLVSSEILQLIQGECRIARKLPGCAEEAQDEVSVSKRTSLEFTHEQKWRLD